MKPQDVTIDNYGRPETYHWLALDPTVADLGATWGLRGPHGTTYLLVEDDRDNDWSHRLIAVGCYSGLYDLPTGKGADALADDIARNRKCAIPSLIGIDRKIKKADFISWVLK